MKYTKILGYTVIALIVLIGLFYALNSYIYNEKQGDGLTGLVTKVSLEQMMVDGPGLVYFKTKAGIEHTIAIPSMGIMLCAAKDNIDSVSDTKVGDTVSVNGEIGEGGMIIPCSDVSHYFKINKN